jgi:hypothetical protein
MEHALLTRNACVFIAQGTCLSSRCLANGQMRHIINTNFCQLILVKDIFDGMLLSGTEVDSFVLVSKVTTFFFQHTIGTKTAIPQISFITRNVLP